MKKVAVIALCGQRFQDIFWRSYLNCEANYDHDLILVHRDFLGVPNQVKNKDGGLILENKIINGQDVPHMAFGAYRYFFYKYREDYEYFVFISDDVVLKRDEWLKNIIETLDCHDKIGFGASQIHNGEFADKKYPHPSHLKAPFWFAKTECLNKIDWQFESTGDGELRIGNQCAAVDYVGVQVGNKINLGYDALEDFRYIHATQVLEMKYYNEYFPFEKYSKNMQYELEKYLKSLDESFVQSQLIDLPYPHIPTLNVFYDIEPFHGLIFYPSLETAKRYDLVTEFSHNINILTPSIML
jgi:hypothetical protein